MTVRYTNFCPQEIHSERLRVHRLVTEGGLRIGQWKKLRRRLMQDQQEDDRAARARFLGIQVCPNCGEEIHGAIAAEYVCESQVRTVWRCDSCDHLSRSVRSEERRVGKECRFRGYGDR